jgi:hypothetical protein
MCPGLAGTYAVLGNGVRYLKPLATVSFSTFAFAAVVVVMFVHYRLTTATPQQPHVVAVSTAANTHVLSQSAT